MTTHLADRFAGRQGRRQTALGRTAAATAEPLRKAFSVAPAAVGSGLVLDCLLTALGTARAPLSTGAAVVALGLGSMAALIVATARRSHGALVVSVLAAAMAAALAGLPPSRPDAAVVAAASGAVLLAIAEAGGYAIDAGDSKIRRNNPGLARAGWVAGVGVAGGAAGWLVVAMATGLSGLGDVALGLGVLAGACLMVLIGAMAHAAVGASAEESGTRARTGEEPDARSRTGVSRLLRRAPSPRGHRRGHDATPSSRRRPGR